MAVLLLSFLIIALSLMGLAAGVLLGRAPIRGSCGDACGLDHINCAACPHRRREEHT